MTKTWMLLLAVSSVSPAWASTYSIEIEAQMNGGNPIHGKAAVLEGEAGSITYGNTIIRFVPTAAGNGAVRIQAEISKKAASGIEIVARPSVITLLNQSAEISQKQADGSNSVRLKLTPTLR